MRRASGESHGLRSRCRRLAAQHLSALPSSSRQIFVVRSCAEETRAPVRSAPVPFPVSAIFVSRSGAASETWHPTPIEAQAPPERSARERARGRETQSCPRTGLLNQATSPKRVRYLQARGRGRVKQEREIVVARRGRVSHHSNALPDPWFLITPCRRTREDVITDERGPRTARVRRLAHPPSPRDAARNLSIEKTVPRDNM